MTSLTGTQLLGVNTVQLVCSEQQTLRLCFVLQATRQPGGHAKRPRLLGPERGLLPRPQPLCLQVGPPSVPPSVPQSVGLSTTSCSNSLSGFDEIPPPFLLHLLCSSSDKSVKVWDAASRTCINTFFDHQDQVTSMLLSGCLICKWN